MFSHYTLPGLHIYIYIVSFKAALFLYCIWNSFTLNEELDWKRCFNAYSLSVAVLFLL